MLLEAVPRDFQAVLLEDLGGVAHAHLVPATAE